MQFQFQQQIRLIDRVRVTFILHPYVGIFYIPGESPAFLECPDSSLAAL
jgi:hypothetical protein